MPPDSARPQTASLSSNHAQFPILDLDDRLQVVAWHLSTTTSGDQVEGFVNMPPLRELVDDQLINLGKEHSGIFRIIATFQDGWKTQGTAFAIGKYHAMTAAHLLWNLARGAARMVTLYPDARFRGDQVDNDFCVLAVAKPFEAGVRIRRCHPNPGSSCAENGTIIGFPSDISRRRLILSKGLVEYHELEDVLKIEHKIDTVKGSSGSPVIVDSLVVGVHSRCIDAWKNAATPVNRNDNDVEYFRNVLRYMRGTLPRKQLKIVNYLGEVEDVAHLWRLYLFGNSTSSVC
ncbi:hypothetical protein F5Y12DRAFT_790696 [Xylaria sp. FL1777]|nr:hypothetical protein F5Y12DRAFT_790696 [Xylaria sp. FL1777]